MTGDPANAHVWANADVYIGSIDAVNPVGGAPFGDDWDAVGLLSGDDGFDEKIAVTGNDFYAWGGLLIATSRTDFKLTRSFTTYEDNETVFDLWYAGHDVTFGDGTYAGTVNVPDLQASFKIAFETRTGGNIKRVISSNYAQVDTWGDTAEGEKALASRQVTVAVYPAAADGEGKLALFETYFGPATAPVPSLRSALPTAGTSGSLITVEGTFLSTTTGATIGGIAATHVDVVDDSHLVVELPTASAGSAPIIVTNAVGASSPLAYTRGA